jgi:ATP-dependent Clp protease ATP-binding subunit ClpA
VLDGSPMFERFTNRARHVVVLSQEEARELQHNYIGTEHILLGLLAESDGAAFQALARFGMTLDGARDEVKAIIGLGKAKPSGHIPFTPRAKKVLELSLREALQLRNDFIGTEHILLGVIREGQGVGAQIIKQHCPDLSEVRTAVLEVQSTMPAPSPKGFRWLRDRLETTTGRLSEQGQGAQILTTQAADASLTEAARLAGSQPVGSHHLVLAALADPGSAASQALSKLGELERLKEALRSTDVAGTSDELPEEAGRRQMVIKVTPEKITIEATDQPIIELGQAAVAALGDQAGVIQGSLPAAASLSNVWRSLHDSFEAIRRRAEEPRKIATQFRPGPPEQPGTGSPEQPGTGSPEQPGTEAG